MHELAVMESIVDAVNEQLPDAQVVVIRIEVGRLTCIAADALRFCHEVVTRGTRLENAALDIIQRAARAHCRQCGSDFEAESLLAVCSCGSMDLAIEGGDQLRLKEVEVL